MHLTVKQLELMRVITAAAAGTDLDEILENVRYETTKQSLHFSIRALVKHGLIEKTGMEKRRGRQRKIIAATKTGMAYAARIPEKNEVPEPEYAIDAPQSQEIVELGYASDLPKPERVSRLGYASSLPKPALGYASDLPKLDDILVPVPGFSA